MNGQKITAAAFQSRRLFSAGAGAGFAADAGGRGVLFPVQLEMAMESELRLGKEHGAAKLNRAHILGENFGQNRVIGI